MLFWYPHTQVQFMCRLYFGSLNRLFLNLQYGKHFLLLLCFHTTLPSLSTGTYLLLERNLLRGPAAAISITSIRFSALHRPSMRTMNGLLSWYMISASLIISSFTNFSFSFFSTLMATSTWPLRQSKAEVQISAHAVRAVQLKSSLYFIMWKSHASVLRTPFLTLPKFPEPSSTSSMRSWSLWMLNLLISFGLWYGLNPGLSMGRRSAGTAAAAFETAENSDEVLFNHSS